MAVGSECWLESLPARLHQWIRVLAGVLASRADGVLVVKSMDPSVGWSSCQQGFWGALAVVH